MPDLAKPTLLKRGQMHVSVTIAASKRSKSTPPSTALRLRTVCMQMVSSMKILRDIFTSNLSWQDLTLATCSKKYQKLGALRRFGGSLDVKTCAHLFKIYCKPDLDYC